MCCAVPGTKYLLDKVMVIIIIMKVTELLLWRCSHWKVGPDCRGHNDDTWRV